VTTPAAVLLVLAAVAAVGDWVAVARRPSPLEYLCKPATLVLLVGVALTLDPVDGAERWWVVAALVLSLAGDVFLLPRPDWFVAGLASFLLGHVAYVVGFLVRGGGSPWALAAVVVVAVAGAVVGTRVLRAVRDGPDPSLALPVVAYMAVISAMVVTAAASGVVLAIVGALLFYASDATLALDRFQRPRRWGPLVVIVAYHLGQAFLVLSVASTR
jgi:uncharacterized membrane protein YhhN